MPQKVSRNTGFPVVISVITMKNTIVMVVSIYSTLNSYMIKQVKLECLTGFAGIIVMCNGNR